jgi:glucosamine-6-phosphate deaminase
MKELRYGCLCGTVLPTTAELGKAGALALTEILEHAVGESGKASVILAIGNSQPSFYATLRKASGVPWDKVTVFHMDEYLGMSDSHPASFRRYRPEKLVDAVKSHAFHGI